MERNHVGRWSGDAVTWRTLAEPTIAKANMSIGALGANHLKTTPQRGAFLHAETHHCRNAG
jgi:hypothetical protein